MRSGSSLVGLCKVGISQARSQAMNKILVRFSLSSCRRHVMHSYTCRRYAIKRTENVDAAALGR